MQGPVAIILISWNVIFIWETGYWTRDIKRFALFDLLKSLYSNTKILSKNILSLQRRQQRENWENRNGPNLVQAFPTKWWVESDFTAPNLPLPLRLKGSGCHYYSMCIYSQVFLCSSLLFGG
jgi:hypothetical protein